MNSKIPRITIAGLRGSSGKTLVALGLVSALCARGQRVLPFKKGPDYIDAAWHSLAAGVPCRNLDTFMMGEDQVSQSFLRNSQSGDIAIIEGNRGIFDGVDSEGTHSTAELAKLLECPALLVIDCTKATRSIAAMVLGCRHFDPELQLAGVVLNNIATPRQERIVQQAIRQYTDVPVLGAVPHVRNPQFHERHLGLVPSAEHPRPEDTIHVVREAVEAHIDIDAILEAARGAGPLEALVKEDAPAPIQAAAAPRIGIIRDGAFNFYYPENIEQLEALGAELVELSALHDNDVPALDALYIGGGFPETHAQALAANESFRHSLRARIESGLPVYAECGGLTYLSESITFNDAAYPMVGAFPIAFTVEKKPQGHGYVIMHVDRPNPFFEIGTTLRGHEFRYSRAIDYQRGSVETACHVERGVGFDGERAGLCYKNVFGSFCHLHALGTTAWAPALLRQARAFKNDGPAERSEAPCPLTRMTRNYSVKVPPLSSHEACAGGLVV